MFMVTPATTVRVFGIYLIGAAIGLMLAPNLLLAGIGAPPALDVWVRMTGMVAAIIGYYYLRAAAMNLRPLFVWSVHARLAVPVVIGAFIVAGMASPVLMGFGIVDAIAAYWTWSALRRENH
jgi:hypothetical protein